MPPNEITFLDLRWNPETGELRGPGGAVVVPYRAGQALSRLMQGGMWSLREIGSDYASTVSPECIRQYIYVLRKALNCTGSYAAVLTRKGYGFQLVDGRQPLPYYVHYHVRHRGTRVLMQ